MQDPQLNNLKAYILSNDLLLAAGYNPSTVSGLEDENDPIFFTKTFLKENKEIELDQFKLEQDELLEIGKQITILRKNFEEKASEAQVLNE